LSENTYKKSAKLFGILKYLILTAKNYPAAIADFTEGGLGLGKGQ